MREGQHSDEVGYAIPTMDSPVPRTRLSIVDHSAGSVIGGVMFIVTRRQQHRHPAGQVQRFREDSQRNVVCGTDLHLMDLAGQRGACGQVADVTDTSPARTSYRALLPRVATRMVSLATTRSSSVSQ